MRKTILAGILLVLCTSVVALLAGTLTVDGPTNATLIKGTTFLNISFADLANVTIAYRFNGGGLQTLDAVNNQPSPYNVSLITQNGTFSDGVYLFTIAAVNSTEATDTDTTHWQVTIDNSPPRITSVSFSPNNHPNSSGDDISMNVNAIDHNGVTSVLLNSSGIQNFSLGGNSSHRTAQGTFDLASLGCANEQLCVVTIYASDALGNTNDSIQTNHDGALFYIDSNPPVVATSGVNASSIAPGESFVLFARWSDVSLLDSTATKRVGFLHMLNATTARLLSSDATINFTQTGNYTNVTRSANTSDEGTTLTFRIQLNDSNGNSATTGDILVGVTNQAPMISINTTNNTNLDDDPQIMFTALDYGSGFMEESFLRVTITNGTTTQTLNFSEDLGEFDCNCAGCEQIDGVNGSGFAGTLSNWTCMLEPDLPTGDVDLSFFVTDRKGNTNTTAITVDVEEEEFSSSSGGGGGGGAAPKEVIDGTVETSYARLFANVGAGDTLDYTMQNNVTFTRFIIHFGVFSEAAKITVRKFREKPQSLAAIDTAYSFMHVEHTGVSGMSDSNTVEFAVPKQWLTDNGLGTNDIALFRYESGRWIPYDAVQMNTSATSYTYRVLLPGFSYFAVAKKQTSVAPAAFAAPMIAPDPIVIADTQEVVTVTPEPTVLETVQTVEPAQKTAVAEESSGVPWTPIIIATGIAMIVVVVGMIQYRRSTTKKLVKHDDNPLTALRGYIQVMQAKGIPPDQIKQKLTGVGWQENIVDAELGLVTKTEA